MAMYGMLQLNGEKWAFEIKLTGSPGKDEMDRLIKTAEIVNADKAILVSRTRKEIKGANAVPTNLSGVLTLLEG